MKFDRELFVHIFVICLILTGGFLLSLQLSSSNNKSKEEAVVTKVIDGDTIIVEGGESVRLLGIDADERGYPCYNEAKRRLEELILGKEVRLVKTSQNRGIYGRYLRYIFHNDTNINLKLLKEGMVIVRFFEDSRFKKRMQEAERFARENKLGCKWSETGGWLKNSTQLKSNNFTDPCEAQIHKGEKITVYGKVVDTFRSENDNVFLNFGSQYPNHCFTAVIFSDDLDKFDGNLTEYFRDREVRVEGEVMMYRGKPEIIVEEKSQIKAY